VNKRRIALAAGLVVASGSALVVTGIMRKPAATASGHETSIATTQVTRADLVATDRIDGTLGYETMPPVVVHRAGIYTSVPDEGATIDPGHPLVSIDGQPVVLLQGATPAYRDIGPGVTDGDDVQELEASLVALGFDPSGSVSVDRHFTNATAAVIDRFQQWFGMPQTGVIALGDVVFEPTSVRVGTRQARLGTMAAPGDQPFTATSPARVVSVDLDASRQRGVQPGEPVTIDLLDGATTAGTVASVGRVASTPPDSAGGPARPTVAMTISLADPAATGSFDQQPVQVELATATRQHVLAVPVTALVALAEGGDGLEVVDPSGPHRYVAVTTGLFTDTLVEITSGAISEGTTVVVAR
jgi:peptidoglycan hydrolase-like protein with peptidoglycan-binding domain